MVIDNNAASVMIPYHEKDKMTVSATCAIRASGRLGRNCASKRLPDKSGHCCALSSTAPDAANLEHADYRVCFNSTNIIASSVNTWHGGGPISHL